ncbi:MAG: type II toxin-antitoxin system RelE family toxin [Kiritimatiellia bacterium]
MPRREEVVLSEYKIFETDEFQKQLKKITSSKRKVVEKKLSEYVYPQLKSAPCYGPNIKKLKGYEPETWRYRIGNYRVFYTMDNEEPIVYILTVDDRKDAYK